MRRALFALTLLACGPQSDTCEVPPDLSFCEQGTYLQDDDGDGVTDSSVSYVTVDDHTRVERYDEDGDGEIDGSVTYRSDDQGRVVSVSYDDNGDGAADRRDTYTWVDDGLTSTVAYDQGADGVVELVSSTTYDEQARPVAQRSDVAGDGVIDTVETWARDDAGHITEHAVDFGDDGVIDRVERFVFDEQGRLASESSAPPSLGGAASTTYAYDACGRLATVVYGFEGGRSSTLTYGYDEAGRLASTTRDDGSDGEPDAVTMTFWRDNTAYTDLDAGVDGEADGYWEADYDDAGRQVASRSDFDGDGRLDQAWSMVQGCEDGPPGDKG